MTRDIGAPTNRSSVSLINTRARTWTSPSMWSPWAWVRTTSETSSSFREAAAIAAGSSCSRLTSIRANGTFRAVAVSPVSTSRRTPSCSIAQQWIGSGSENAPGMNRSSWRRGPELGNRKLCLTRTAPVVRAWICMCLTLPQFRNWLVSKRPTSIHGPRQLPAAAVVAEPSARTSAVSSPLWVGWAGSSASAITAPAAATPAAR